VFQVFSIQFVSVSGGA